MRSELPQVRIFDVPFCKWGMEQTVAYLTEAVQKRDPHQIITANPIMIMEAVEKPAFLRIMQQADLVVPDGAGAVWASQKIGQPVAERVAGFDLLHELMQVGNDKGWSVFLLGAAPEIVMETERKLKEKYPNVRFAGVRDGYFKDEQDEAVIEQIQSAKPDLLFVARAAANQEPWIAKYKSRLAVPVMMGVGGSFDVIAGKLKRAPKPFQRLRLEWLYRLLQEPKRYKRMLVLPKFAVKVIREKENMKKQ
ncbi:WecB/TagA/CpsF family glycosyltransferase [Marinicrinis sediminis]|uniref:N-acetylglucosaminyldiphosphoundecaprenol N-acetyl-beta-D-mannosaminyltransferase n=1 Tax=Marinicrinis sediminis TaxID=1652465 RepID=A0ABW5RAJ9_9BACL